MDSHEEKRKMKRTVNVPTSSLEIPMELAFLMEKGNDIPPMHTERNWISAVGRVPTFPLVKNGLPPDINNYILPRFFKDHGINFQMGFRTSPLIEPIIPKSNGDLAKRSVDAFKLILRFTFDDTLTQSQEHILGSYIVHMAMQNLEMREEIYVQVMNQCISYDDEVGLKRLWLLMANLLSACKPGDRIENYVIKFVTDHGINGWNTLCQMKILSARPQCRLFPPCSLEWKSNKKSARVALPVTFLDGQTITLDVDSFMMAEDLARHGLSIRADSIHGLKGWSLALQLDNEITEMGGHGYVLDPLSCAELRSDWGKIGGSTGSMFFLISKDVNRTPRANMVSSELDSWLEDVFDQALTSERSMDPKQVQGWIHGLGDPMMPQVPQMGTVPLVQTGMSVPIVGATGMALGAPSLVGVADPVAQAQTAQLQVAIQQAQLQNTLLQHNVQREMLVSQLNQLQAVNTQQQLQRNPILQPAQPQVGLTMQGQVFQPPVVQQQAPLVQRRAPIVRQQSEQKSPVNQHIGGRPPAVRTQSQEVRSPLNFGESMNNSYGEPMSPDSERFSPRERLSQGDSEVLKNRARTIRVGRVSWPPPMANSDEPTVPKPEPKRLPIERDPDAPKRNFNEPKPKPSRVSTTSVEPKSPKSAEPVQVVSKSMPAAANAPAITVNIVTPKSAPEKSTASITINSSKEMNSLKQEKQPERKFSPAMSAPSHILTEEDFKGDRSPAQKRAEEVPHVDVAGRARQLAGQLFLGNEVVENTNTIDSPKTGLDKYFSGHITKLLDSGSDMRHYMYTLVPWKLLIRKEIFSPDERMESPMLLDLLFSQIVFDVVKQPCIRMSIDEKKRMRALMANHNISTKLDDLKKQSIQVKKLFVDAAKASPFYFGRFYAAEWHTPNSSFLPVSWVMVNHVGVHLVHHQDNDELKLLKTVPFEEIQTVTKVDSRLLSLTTRVNDRYDLICHMVGSLKALIEQYIEASERAPKGVMVRRSDSNISQLRNRSEGIYQRNSEIIVETGGPITPMMPSPGEMEDIIRYGVAHFKDHSRPNVEAIMRWGKSPLKTSLHNFEDPGDEKLAVEAFLAIVTFMNDYPMERETSLVDYALVLLEIPMRQPDLVDEIYCQLIKQTRPVDAENPSRENLASCWRLFSLFAMFFDCSDKLRPYLIRYIQAAARNEELEGVAMTTLKNLAQSQKYGGRKLLPLRSELDAEINGYSAKRMQLSMPRGLKAAVQLTPISVIDEIIEELCSSYGISDDLERNEYTIFTVLTKENISSPLRGEQYAFDVMTDLTMTGRPFHFYFCRTSWVADLQLRNRSAELIDLFYKQTMDDYLAGTWLLHPIGEGAIHQARDISRLTAIQHKVNNALATTITNKEMKPLLPGGVVNYQPLREHEWLARSKAQLRQLVRYTSRECKIDALDILHGWYLFGAMCFAVRTGLRSILPDQNILLCLCRAGLVLLEANTHKFNLSIPFTEVYSYEVTMDASGPTQLDLKVSNDRTIRCYSNQANKIVHVLNQYMKFTNGV